MIDRNPTLGHHFLEVTQAKRIGDVPTNAGQDYFQRIVKPFKHARHTRIQRLHYSPTEPISIEPDYQNVLLRQNQADGLVPEDTKVRSSKYQNNLVEQDHRNIKSRTNVMLGFKRFRSAATTIAGIELMQRIRKGQFNLSIPGPKDAVVPAVWNSVLLN
jgi:DDE domain